MSRRLPNNNQPNLNGNPYGTNLPNLGMSQHVQHNMMAGLMGSNNGYTNDAPVFNSADFPALGNTNDMNASQTQSDFALQKEEFPALSSTPTGRKSRSGKRENPNNQRQASGRMNVFREMSATPDFASNNMSLGNTSQTFMQRSISAPPRVSSFNQPSQSPSQTNSSMQQSNSNANNQGNAASARLEDKYGLKGLLGFIRVPDPDLNTLALGTDLTTLGLNLNSSELLYSTFAYPCAENPARAEPDYVLPFCYYMQPPALKTSHLTKFNLETLFYIFYNMPKDTLQVYAAKELYNRDWRYHKQLQMWFTRQADKQQRAENDGYVCFDISSWEVRVFNFQQYGLTPQQLVSGFMSQEELVNSRS